MIIAMPEGGAVGFYSDWVDRAEWETFHTVELPGILAEKYRASSRQAIAGLSMGGLGALTYAARHPDHYAAVASFSGITHTALPPVTHRTTSGWWSPRARIRSPCGATRTAMSRCGDSTIPTTWPSN